MIYHKINLSQNKDMVVVHDSFEDIQKTVIEKQHCESLCFFVNSIHSYTSAIIVLASDHRLLQ